MYSLIFHGRKSLELHKWRHLGAPLQSAFFSSLSLSAKDGRKGQLFTFSYLVDSLGLTPKLAESISRKVSFENRTKPDSVLSLLTSYGFTKSQILGIITAYPQLLVVNGEKALGPRLKCLQSRVGSSSSDEFTHIVSTVPKILGIKGNDTISRYYDMAKEIIEADKSLKLEKLCHSMPMRMQGNKIRNVSVLREHGVPERLLRPLLISDRKLVCGKGKFEETVKKVVEMGFDPTSSKFVEALRVVQGLSEEAIEQKVSHFIMLGFVLEDVWGMFRKCPSLLTYPTEKVTQKFEDLKEGGLVKEEILTVLKISPEYIVVSEQKLTNFVQTFRALGFSITELVTMIKRCPRCISLSPETVMEKIQFLVNKKNKIRLKKMVWTRKGVVSYPQILGYSMEKRIVPRCNVMKALMSKGLLGYRRSKLPSRESILLCTDEEFLKMYVTMHDDKELVTELMALFTGKQTTC